VKSEQFIALCVWSPHVMNEAYVWPTDISVGACVWVCIYRIVSGEM